MWLFEGNRAKETAPRADTDALLMVLQGTGGAPAGGGRTWWTWWSRDGGRRDLRPAQLHAGRRRWPLPMALVWTGDAKRGLPDRGVEAKKSAVEIGRGVGGARGDRAAGAAAAAAGLEREAERAAGKGGGLPGGVVPADLPELLRGMGVENVKVAVAAVMAAA